VFYREWTEGAGWERYEVPASQCSRISEEFLGEERLALPPWIFAQEYGCQFKDVNDQVFASEAIDRSLRAVEGKEPMDFSSASRKAG
jgi:hypothetical protein